MQIQVVQAVTQAMNAHPREEPVQIHGVGVLVELASVPGAHLHMAFHGCAMAVAKAAQRSPVDASVRAPACALLLRPRLSLLPLFFVCSFYCFTAHAKISLGSSSILLQYT